MEQSKRMMEKIVLNKNTVDFTSGSNFPGNYPLLTVENWSAQKYCDDLTIEIVSEEEATLEFDIIGADAPICNAIRRVLISEIPTVCIDKILLYNNTSIVQDEILCQRLGLVPLKINPKKLKWRYNRDDLEPSSKDTVVFDLQIRCSRNKNANKDETDKKILYNNANVYSSHLKWVPLEGQERDSMFGNDPPEALYPDILLDKLSPGHEIDLRCLCYLGIGKDHVKFSPVGTAFYRLMPQIILKDDFYDEEAYKLQSYFATGVISVEDVKRDKNRSSEKTGKKKARVANPRLDTCNRQVLEDESMRDRIELSKVRNHFLFSVESVAYLKPHELVIEALDVLSNKCDTLIDFLEDATG